MTQVQTAEDRLNGIDLQVLNETLKAVQDDPELGKSKFRVSNKWLSGNQNQSTIKGFYAAKEEHEHKEERQLDADEPELLAGDDEAPNPVEYLLSAVASCVTTSMVAHAAVRGIEIQEVESEIEGDLDLNGFLGLDPNAPKGFTDIRLNFRVKTDEENFSKLESLAQFSPTYNTIVNGAQVDIDIQPM